MKLPYKTLGSPIANACLFISCTLVLFAACRKIDAHNPFLKHFTQVNLVDNNHEYNAPNTDTSLLNAWGIAFSPNGIAWVNSQEGHVSALYNAEGGAIRTPVNIPSPGGPVGGNPTGIVFNGSTDFELSKGGPARFIFVGVDGVLSGWNGQFGDTAELIKNNVGEAVYTGLAIGKSDSANYLYAADFKGGKIQVWDKNFAPVEMSFMDPGIPAGYAPFNIQAIGDWLYVMYAKVGDDGEEEKGDALGFVSIFKTNGDFVKRLASGGALNAPWGIAKAPLNFFDGVEMDSVGNDKTAGAKILVGNFGNGRINVYTESGHWIGALRSRGKPIEIEGLWAITFAPSTATSIDPDRLYFAAGPDDEADGLFGYIIKN
jgi:uncharacterized protein (TIGR03118 family)